VLRLIEKLRPSLIIHIAAQPSHDRAAAIPFLDFEVNALGTLPMLESRPALLSRVALRPYVHE
jgi:CDP-paratose 2-epimerase